MEYLEVPNERVEEIGTRINHKIYEAKGERYEIGAILLSPIDALAFYAYCNSMQRISTHRLGWSGRWEYFNFPVYVVPGLADIQIAHAPGDAGRLEYEATTTKDPDK